MDPSCTLHNQRQKKQPRVDLKQCTSLPVSLAKVFASIVRPIFESSLSTYGKAFLNFCLARSRAFKKGTRIIFPTCDHNDAFNICNFSHYVK